MIKNNLIVSFFALGGMCLVGACATATTTENTVLAESVPLTEETAAVAAGEEDYDPDEIICKNKKATGSRLGRIKDCRTREQWRKSGANASRAVNKMKDNRSHVIVGD